MVGIHPGTRETEAVVLERNKTYYLKPRKQGVLRVRESIHRRAILILEVTDHSIRDVNYRLVTAQDFRTRDLENTPALVLAAGRRGEPVEPSRLVLGHHMIVGSTDISVAVRGVRDPQLALTTDKIWKMGLGITNTAYNEDITCQEVNDPWATVPSARVAPADFKVAPHILPFDQWFAKTEAELEANPPTTTGSNSSGWLSNALAWFGLRR